LTTTVQVKRGTAARMQALANKGGLLEGEPLFITDKKSIAVADTITSYVEVFPNYRQKKLTGITASTQGASVSVSHGLNSAKIIGCDVLIEFDTGYKILNSWAGITAAGYSFSTTIEPTVIAVWNDEGNSYNILSKPFTVLLKYEE
jgi:hypothetical protein